MVACCTKIEVGLNYPTGVTNTGSKGKHQLESIQHGSELIGSQYPRSMQKCTKLVACVRDLRRRGTLSCDAAALRSTDASVYRIEEPEKYCNRSCVFLIRALWSPRACAFHSELTSDCYNALSPFIQDQWKYWVRVVIWPSTDPHSENFDRGGTSWLA